MTIALPWKLAALAKTKGRDADALSMITEEERGERLGLMLEDVAQERWRVPPHVLLRMGLAESYHGAMAAAPADVKASMFRYMLADMSHLALADNLLAAMVEEFPFTLTLVDHKADILMVSRQDFPGVPLEQVIGSNMCDWVPADVHDRIRWAYAQSAANGRWFEGADVLQNSDGLFQTRCWCGPSHSGNVVALHLRPRPIASMAEALPRDIIPL